MDTTTRRQDNTAIRGRSADCRKSYLPTIPTVPYLPRRPATDLVSGGPQGGIRGPPHAENPFFKRNDQLPATVSQPPDPSLPSTPQDAQIILDEIE